MVAVAVSLPLPLRRHHCPPLRHCPLRSRSRSHCGRRRRRRRRRSRRRLIHQECWEILFFSLTYYLWRDSGSSGYFFLVWDGSLKFVGTRCYKFKGVKVQGRRPSCSANPLMLIQV